jgi:hypothetical protein
MLFIGSIAVGSSNPYSWDHKGCFVDCPKSQVALTFRLEGMQFVLLKNYDGINFLAGGLTKLNDVRINAFMFKVFNQRLGSELYPDTFETVSIGTFQGSFIDDCDRWVNAPVTDVHIIDENIPEEAQSMLIRLGNDLFDIFEIMNIPISRTAVEFNDMETSGLGAKYAMSSRWFNPFQRGEFINTFWETVFSYSPPLRPDFIATAFTHNFDFSDTVTPSHHNQAFGRESILETYQDILQQTGLEIITSHNREGSLKAFNLFVNFLKGTGSVNSPEQHGGIVGVLAGYPLIRVLFNPVAENYDYSKFKEFGLDLYRQYVDWGRDAGLDEQFRGFIRTGLLVANTYLKEHFLIHDEVHELLTDVGFDKICEKLINMDLEVPIIEEISEQGFLERPIVNIEPSISETVKPDFNSKMGKVFVVQSIIDGGIKIGSAFTPGWDWTDSRVIDPSINFKT